MIRLRNVFAATMAIAVIGNVATAPSYDPEVEAYKWYTIATELGNTNTSVRRMEPADGLSAEEKAVATDMAANSLESYPALQARQ